MDKFEDLLGKTITNITGCEDGSDEIIFECNHGLFKYRLYHEQCCCESVSVDDVVGDVSDLLNSPILLAEEVSGECGKTEEHGFSYTWTFYKLSTIKGSVTLKWYGESNGYYSESADFEKL